MILIKGLSGTIAPPGIFFENPKNWNEDKVVNQ